jgi:hypothetical protein
MKEQKKTNQDEIEKDAKKLLEEKDQICAPENTVVS